MKIFFFSGAFGSFPLSDSWKDSQMVEDEESNDWIIKVLWIGI
jgi:hypothetical protein